eukprot:15466062-Alexandrium_andersonii.AAC.1
MNEDRASSGTTALWHLLLPRPQGGLQTREFTAQAASNAPPPRYVSLECEFRFPAGTPGKA